jgi:hypothetical protein
VWGADLIEITTVDLVMAARPLTRAVTPRLTGIWLWTLLASCAGGAPAGEAAGRAGGSGETTSSGAASTLAGSAGASGGSVGGAAGGAAPNAGSAGAATGGASASAGSAGTAGAAGSAGAAGGASCVTSGQQLCEDFESGQIDPARWKLTKPTASASITVDGEHVRSGQYAAHIAIVAGQQSIAMLTEAVTFPAANNSFYARAFMYFAPDLPAAPGADFHMGFIFGIGKNDAGEVQAGLGMIGGERQYLGYSIFFGPPKYEFGPWSKAKVEANVWQCIELFEDGSSPNEEKRQVWLDGVELVDLRSTSNGSGAPANHEPPAFDGVSFGIWEYHPSPLLQDVWLDDIRVSDQPIGCE